MTWFDWTILDFIQNHLRSGGMDTLMVWITTLGNGGAVWLAIAAVLLLRKRTRRAGVCLLAAIVLTAACCNLGLKPLIARPRPCHLDPSVPLLIPNPTDFSFPSGHTAASFAAVAALSLSTFSIPGFLAGIAVLGGLELARHMLERRQDTQQEHIYSDF